MACRALVCVREKKIEDRDEWEKKNETMGKREEKENIHKQCRE